MKNKNIFNLLIIEKALELRKRIQVKEKKNSGLRKNIITDFIDANLSKYCIC